MSIMTIKKWSKTKMLVARLTAKSSKVVEIRLDNDYKSDCVNDLARLDTFLDKVSLDVAVTLVKKEGIKATASDVNDAIFGETFGRKGLRVSLMQSSLGENKDKIAEEQMEVHPNVHGLLRDKNTGKMYINGKLMSGQIEMGFIPKGVVSRVKDLIKSKLGLECGKWVRVCCDDYELEIIENGQVKKWN
jgi:hypothetical protein